MAGGLGSPSLGLCKRGDFEISHVVVGPKTGEIHQIGIVAPCCPPMAFGMPPWLLSIRSVCAVGPGGD